MITRLMAKVSRFSLSALVTAVMLFIIAVVAFLVLGVPGHHVAQVFSSHDNSQQDHKLSAYLTDHGAEDCRPTTETVTPSAIYIAIARASAVVTCDVGGSGPQTILGFRFPGKTDLEAWETDNSNYVRGVGAIGTCHDSSGITPWADTTGRLAGNLYCEEANSIAALAWSNKEELSGYYVTSSHDGMGALLNWWEEKVRGRPTTRESGMRAIHARYAKALRGGIAGCTSIQLPLADAALECGRSVLAIAPHGYVDALTLLHFSNAATLNAYYANYEFAYHAPSSEASVYCDSGTLVSSTYYMGAQVVGRIFCYPANNWQFLLWTNEHLGIAGLAARQDENERGLYEAWQALATE